MRHQKIETLWEGGREGDHNIRIPTEMPLSLSLHFILASVAAKQVLLHAVQPLNMLIFSLKEKKIVIHHHLAKVRSILCFAALLSSGCILSKAIKPAQQGWL